MSAHVKNLAQHFQLTAIGYHAKQLTKTKRKQVVSFTYVKHTIPHIE